MHHHGRRVVVTGIGLVTPLGNTTCQSWTNVINGHVGINLLSNEHPIVQSRQPCIIAGQVNDSELPSLPSNTSRCTHFAAVAAREALHDAHYTVPSTDDGRCRVGVAIGCGIGDMQTLYDTSVTLHERGFRRVSPFFVPKILVNMAGGYVCREHKLFGPCRAVSTACATGADAIGDASRFIMCDDADVMLAGGTEACIDVLSMAGFARMRALATGYNTEEGAQVASRPFDADRQGFVMSEGAGVLVLEELVHAQTRGARIYAELVGYGASSDAYHMTQPDPRGIGALTSMRSALRHAGLRVDQVQYVNAHATSTPLGDEIEERAIGAVFGPDVLVSSTKGATGHMLGAAGAVEAAFTALSVFHNVVPGTCNLRNFSNDHVRHVAVEAKDDCEIQAAVCNSFGFGGVNASLLFQKFYE